MVKLLSTIMDRFCCTYIQVCVCMYVYIKRLPLRRDYEIGMRVTKKINFFPSYKKSEILDYFSLSAQLHSNF